MAFDLREHGGVELRGLEPRTSCMPSTGSTSTAVHRRRPPSCGVRTSPPGIQPGCGTFALYSPERPPASAPVAVLSWLPGEATAWRSLVTDQDASKDTGTAWISTWPVGRPYPRKRMNRKEVRAHYGLCHVHGRDLTGLPRGTNSRGPEPAGQSGADRRNANQDAHRAVAGSRPGSRRQTG